jgi:hypothetical protein
MKIEELESLLENFQETIQSQLDNNDVGTLMEQVLNEKEFCDISRNGTKFS